jgi:hypothetical protein
MRLVRDVLDMQIVDAEEAPLGRVDAIVAQWQPDAPPRVLWLEVSGPALARRLHPALGRWARRLARRLSPTRGRAWRIPWSDVGRIDMSVHLRRGARTARARPWERWLREHVVRRIPGA